MMVFAGLALMFAGIVVGVLWILIAAFSGTGPYSGAPVGSATRGAIAAAAIALLLSGTVVVILAAQP